MTLLQMLTVGLITPVSALLIAAWVLRENRKIGDKARARASAANVRS